jgi:hypothetical protein
MEDTFHKIKDKAKEVAEKVTDEDTYLGDSEQKEKNNEEYGTEGQHGSNEPMNPEEINKHEPTAVKRDKNQSSTGDPV